MQGRCTSPAEENLAHLSLPEDGMRRFIDKPSKGPWSSEVLDSKNIGIGIIDGRNQHTIHIKAVKTIIVLSPVYFPRS